MPSQRRALGPTALYLVHLLFAIHVPVYGLVYYFNCLRPGHQPLPAHPVAVLFPVLLVCGLMAMLAGLFIPKLLGRKATATGGNAATSFLWRCVLKLILSDACFEAIAVWGLTGGIMGMGQGLVFAMIALAFALLLINFARLRSWMEDYESLRTQ